MIYYLFYSASKEAFDQGYIPTLYTDADYEASNQSYQKIGFEVRGNLCMVGLSEIKFIQDNPYQGITVVGGDLRADLGTCVGY